MRPDVSWRYTARRWADRREAQAGRGAILWKSREPTTAAPPRIAVVEGGRGSLVGTRAIVEGLCTVPGWASAWAAASGHTTVFSDWRSFALQGLQLGVQSGSALV